MENIRPNRAGLVAVTASIGYAVGWAFAVLWNTLHK